MDIIVFLNIGKQDIYQPKSLGKTTTDFYLNIQKLEKSGQRILKLATDLLKRFCDRYPAYHYMATEIVLPFR